MRTRLVLLVVFLVIAASAAMAIVDPAVDYSLVRGKSLIALPAVPLDPFPESVFGTIFIDGRLTRYDSIVKGSILYNESNPPAFGNLLIGEGYWIRTIQPELLSYAGLTDTDNMDIWISLPRAGWNLIGNPFSFNFPFANIKVTDGNETVSLLEASRPNRNWLYSIMTWYDASVQGTRFAGLPEDEYPYDQLLPWHGYWCYSFVDKIALILESPTGP